MLAALNDVQYCTGCRALSHTHTHTLRLTGDCVTENGASDMAMSGDEWRGSIDGDYMWRDLRRASNAA